MARSPGGGHIIVGTTGTVGGIVPAVAVLIGHSTSVKSSPSHMTVVLSVYVKLFQR